jgi:Rad3-related DNA helicase
MEELVDPLKITEQSLRKAGEQPLNPEQREMITPMFEALQTPGVVFVGQGPTGMGKTYVIAGVTKALVQQGKRVCIALPSYTHLEEVMHSHLEKLEVDHTTLHGLSALREDKGQGCPLKGGKIPSPIFCNEAVDAPTGPYSQKCSSIDCTVRQELASLETSNVTLTVFHKLIAKTALMNRFDVVIFDESHGLEPTLRNARLVKIRKHDLEVLKSATPASADLFTEVITVIDQLQSRGKEDIPTVFVDRKIITPLKSVLGQVRENIRDLESGTGWYNANTVSAYYSLERSIGAVDREEQYRFLYHDESILGIPLKITFAPFGRKFGTKRPAVALISATIENPKFHANDAGFQFHTLAPPIQVQSERLIRTRFNKRPIIGLVDGPVLRMDPQFPDSYKSARIEANKTIESILPSFKHPTLILCRNGTDARSIESHLRKTESVQSRLFLFEEEESAIELETVETHINNEIEKGRDIIVTTASSRLWEGINLKSIRMLVVDALPYPSPQPSDRFERQAWGSWRTSRTFRFMIRRLQQGVGRLVRTDKDPWGIVVVVDGRFNAQWKTIKSALPIYMTSPEIISFVTRANLKTELDRTILRLENANIEAFSPAK